MGAGWHLCLQLNIETSGNCFPVVDAPVIKSVSKTPGRCNESIVSRQGMEELSYEKFLFNSSTQEHFYSSLDVVNCDFVNIIKFVFYVMS